MRKGVVLLFDIDGTLLRTGGAGAAAVAEAFGALFPDCAMPDAPEASFQGRTDREIFATILVRAGRSDDEETLTRFAEAYLAALPRTLAARGAKALPGAPEALAFFRAREEIALGIATGNLEAGARMKLEHVGLWEPFAFGGFGSDAVLRAEIVRIAARRGREVLAARGYDAAAVWVVGDTPRDIAAAREAGARVAAVCTFYPPAALAAADLVLPDLTAFDRLYRALRGG